MNAQYYEAIKYARTLLTDECTQGISPFVSIYLNEVLNQRFSAVAL